MPFVNWDDLAVQDRLALMEYIAARNPRAAVSVDLRISESIRTLETFPFAGREGRIANTRELFIPRTSQVAVYIVREYGVRILRLIHVKQDWPSDPHA